jgi:hypothetical protein
VNQDLLLVSVAGDGAGLAVALRLRGDGVATALVMGRSDE